MSRYDSLDHFKKDQRISDNNGSKISFIFKELFDEYLNTGLSNQKVTESLLDILLDECKEVNPTLIPYEDITNVIFAEYYDNGTEFPFTEKLKSEYEKWIIKKFSEQATNHYNKTPKSNEDLFKHQIRNARSNLIISEEYENAILVIYKVIQHTELAVSQKQSLYENLKNEIDYLDNTVNHATSKYDNMMSNFISILGIFAAIMMATFGAIQGFSAIYSNENGYNFTTIILISCFGLFALISVLYILLYSISKLVNKELSNDFYYQTNVFIKYPIYSHTILIISIIFLLALTHLFKSNPPNYFPNHLIDNVWGYTILVSILIVLIYYIHILIAQSNGYSYINRHLSNYIMSVKKKLGLKRLLNI